MKWRELHNNAFVTWFALFLGVAGLFYGVWSNQQNQPKRQISYFLGNSLPLMNLDVNGPNELVINGQSFNRGTVYSNILYVWNSGNQPITNDDIGEPLLWGNAPSTVKTTYIGIRKDQVDGDIQSGLRFRLLYPNTGLMMVFYTDRVPEVSMSGSISGSNGSSGLLKRVKWFPAPLGSYPILAAGMILVVSCCLIFMRGAPIKSIRETPWIGLSTMLFASAGTSAFILLVVVTLAGAVINADLPPF
jgi:hypothetical protein